MPLKKVAVLVRDGMSLMEFGVTAEVFGIDRSAVGLPAFDYVVCTDGGPRLVRSKHTAPVHVQADHGLEALVGADAVIVSAVRPTRATPAEREALRAAHAAGATLVSLCSGVFLLADAGLLDGRRCATHWLFADQLRREYPAIDVAADELYVDDGDIVTAAGTAAAVDTCLHLVRRELGAEMATGIARRMVVAPHRSGGQRQFVATPVPPTTAAGLGTTLDWVLADLSRARSVDEMAAHAGLSPRQFARRFRAEVGITPHQWLTQQRVAAAQAMLEQGHLSVGRIAHHVGWTSATQLREHFARHTGITPGDYRAAFGVG